MKKKKKLSYEQLVEIVKALEKKLKAISCIDCGKSEFKHSAKCEWRDR